MGNESRMRTRGDDAAYGQRPAGTRPSAEDPLAELARLIGQEDPFAEFFRENSDARTGAASQAPAPQPRSARSPARPTPPEPARPQPPRSEAPRSSSGSFSALAAEVYAEPIPRQSEPRGEPRARTEPRDIPDVPRPVARAPRDAEAPRPVERTTRSVDFTVEAAVAEALGQSFAAPAPQTAPVRDPYARDAAGRAAPVSTPMAAPAQDTSFDRGVPQPVNPAALRPAGRVEPQSRGGYNLDDEAYDYGRTALDRDGYDSDASADAGEGYDEYDEYEAYEEERPARGRSRLMLIGAVVVVVLLGAGAGYFGLRALTGGGPQIAAGQPPIIKADQGPSKVAPAQPAGGDQAADGQKLIYDRVGGDPSGNERVVSSQEEPVDPSQAAQPQAVQPRVILPPTGGSGPSPSPSAPAPLGAMPSSAAQAETSTPNPASTEPKRVRTLTVRADGTIVDDSSAPALQAPPATVALPGSAPVSAYAPDEATPSDTSPAASMSAPSMPENVPLPPTRVAAAPAPAAATSSTAAAAASGYYVQVAAQRSESEAQAAWRMTQNKYPGILRSYTANIRRADLGDRGIYYRAQVGPFGSKDQANELCQSLRAQGGDCMVQRN